MTFAPGETSKIISIELIDDTIVEPNETFHIVLQLLEGPVTYDGGNDIAVVTIIDNDNHAPVAVADTNGPDTVVESGVNPGNTPFAGDASATGNVLTNDTDVDASDSKTVVGVAAGTAIGPISGGVAATITGLYGTLNVAANGAWTYSLDNADPDTNALSQGQAASDVFTYTLADSQGADATATLTINLTGTNDDPVIAVGGGTTGVVQEDAVNPATGHLDAIDPDNGAMLTWTAQGGTSSADADYLFSADSFTVTRNGGPFYLDTFSDGSPPPSGPPAPGNPIPPYVGVGVNGFVEVGGKLIFDSDNAVSFEGPGAPDPILGQNAILRTNIDPASPNGLKDTANFTVSGVFDLILPDSPREAYGVRLTDRHIGGNGTPPDQLGDDDIELVVRQNLSGNVVVALREVDFVNDVTTNIQSIILVPPAGTDQIRLNLVHSTTDTGAIHASFEYLDNGMVIGSQNFTQVGRIFGTETSGFTGDDENWTRAEIIAYAPEHSDSILSGNFGTLNINQAGNWAYNLDNSRAATQNLAEGQTATDVFTVQVTDEFGASDTQTVTITVGGTNDAPVMQTAAVSRTTAEDSETPNLTETGLAQFSDVDLIDVHGVGTSLQSATLNGAPVSPGLYALLAGAMMASLNSGNDSTGDGHGEVKWDFVLANSAVQFLASDDMLTATYAVTVDDGHGGTASQNVTIAITGENDAPTFSGTTYAGQASSISIGDVNGDAYPDLVYASPATNSVKVLLNNGDGTFVAGTSNFAPASEHAILADFNEDSNLDIAAANTFSSSVGALLGNGDGTFDAEVNYPAGFVIPAVAAYDVDEDGNLDLVSSSYYDNQVSVLLGNGDGTFDPRYTVGVGGISNYGVTVADLGNGHGDIIIATPNSNTISILMGDGTGNFASPVTLSTNSPLYVTVADLGDGNPDLIVANRDTAGTVSVFRGNGDGTFQPADTYAVGSSPFKVDVGDMNGDGIVDIVVGNAGSNSVSILLGNGDETFQPETSYAVGASPFSVAVQDLNADGHSDIAVAGNNGIHVLLNTSNDWMI